MTPDDEKPNYVARVLGILIALLLYVLSFGPAAHVIYRLGAYGALDTVYAPVLWLYRNTPLRDPLDAYVGLWSWVEIL